MRYRLETATATHPGPRPTNQDAATADPRLGFAAVADGMGGAVGGEVASAETLAAVRQTLERSPSQAGASLQSLLEFATAEAQRRVCARADGEPKLLGMGSTLALLALADDRYGVANVGDSRVYLLRKKELTQLSHDHSLVQERVDRGTITPDQAAAQPDRNVITRAIGVPGSATPHIRSGQVQPGDRFLLTSDGIHGVLSATDLVAPDEAETAQHTARRLLELALTRGTNDNATIAVLRVLGEASGSYWTRPLVWLRSR